MEVKERSGGSEREDELKQLRKAPVNKVQVYTELHKQYSVIEAEYQKIYAKTHKIQA